ncbi:hypothetical protein GGR07_001649 [Bacteroides pyogenes]|nr:hypothetical protein [Bacteroides pyogenes]SUV70686.1 Uncharacterised protein [Bacteroides pyogenes]
MQKVIRLSSVFYSSAERQTNKTQTKDEWYTTDRRKNTLKKRVKQ